MFWEIKVRERKGQKSVRDEKILLVMKKQGMLIQKVERKKEDKSLSRISKIEKKI